MKTSKRSENWTPVEKKLLLESIIKFKDIIECKSNETKVWKRKRDVWKEIAETFESNGFLRDVEGIRGQWKRLKHAAKMNLGQFEKYNIKTEENLSESVASKMHCQLGSICLENLEENSLQSNKAIMCQETKFKTTKDRELGENGEVERLIAANEERRKEEIHQEVMKQLTIDRQKKEVELDTAKLLYEKAMLEYKKIKEELNSAY